MLKSFEFSQTGPWIRLEVMAIRGEMLKDSVFITYVTESGKYTLRLNSPLLAEATYNLFGTDYSEYPTIQLVIVNNMEAYTLVSDKLEITLPLGVMILLKELSDWVFN